MLFGKDTEADANARANVRQMFDGDMLIHGDLLVSTADLLALTLQEADLIRTQYKLILALRNAH